MVWVPLKSNLTILKGNTEFAKNTIRYTETLIGEHLGIDMTMRGMFTFHATPVYFMMQ